MPPPVSIKLGRKSDEELRQALESHEHFQRRALGNLRDRLQAERTARDILRRDKQLNEYIVRKLEGHRSESSGLTIGGASEAFASRNIEDKRDIDTRIKRYKQSEQCEVIDVTAWARTLPAANVTISSSTPGSGRRTTKRPKKVVTSRLAAIIEPRLTARSVEDPSPGRSSTARTAGSPTLLTATGGANSSSKHTSFVTSARSGSMSARDLGGSQGSPSRSLARQSSRHGAEKKKPPPRGMAGLRSQVSNVLLPSLAVGSGITARGIQQCELDFTMLSYGKSHIPLQAFLEYGTEHVADYGHRRVMFIEFIDYMKRNNVEHLPLAHFVHIVHPRWQRSGIASAVQKCAPALGWAVGLPFDLAECIDHIWQQARTEPNEDGAPTISFDEFARLTNVESSFALDYADVRQMFYATDEDGNGTLDKHEFARFIAGKVNVADSMPPEQVLGDDGPAQPPGSPSGAESAAEDSAPMSD